MMAQMSARTFFADAQTVTWSSTRVFSPSLTATNSLTPRVLPASSSTGTGPDGGISRWAGLVLRLRRPSQGLGRLPGGLLSDRLEQTDLYSFRDLTG